MKRLVAGLAAIVLAASAAWCAPEDARNAPKAPSDGGKSIAVADLAPGMRVRLEISTTGRSMTGTITQATPTLITLDLSTEDRGLPGKLRFKRDEIMLAWQLPQLSKEERDVILERQRAQIARIKVEVAERSEKMKSELRAEETRAKKDETSLRKAMDVVVEKDQEAKMRALLAEFPPDKWTDDTAREIRERWVLYKLAPNAEQNRFLEVFDQWKDARDTIAVLDARDKEKSGEILLIKFPPSEGWGKTKLDAINAKEAAGGKLTDAEAEFKKVWPDWQAAAVKRVQEVTSKPADTTKPATDATTPAPAPAPSKPSTDDGSRPTIVGRPAPPAPTPAPATPPATPTEEKPAEDAAK